MIRFYPRPKVIIICAILVAMMLRLSYWQWQRHGQKQAVIAEMAERLAAPISELPEITDRPVDDLAFRRVRISGRYDFANEMILRNRRVDDQPGVFLITPLRIDGDPRAILVIRGFVPLAHSKREARAVFARPTSESFVGLVKAPLQRRMFAPRDPTTGNGAPWVDAWLRVDVAAMQRQLPYPILPFYVEKMSTLDAPEVQKEVLSSDEGRNEIMFLAKRAESAPGVVPFKEEDYPKVVFDTVVPPGRHLGYVYEWAIMALMTILIGVVIQLRPPPKSSR